MDKVKGDEPEKLNPVEVFQVLGASQSADPDELKSKAEEVGASPEVVDFMNQLPEDTADPADVVQAAIAPKNNDANAQLDLSGSDAAADKTKTNQHMEELTLDDVVTGGEGSAE